MSWKTVRNCSFMLPLSELEKARAPAKAVLAIYSAAKKKKQEKKKKKKNKKKKKKNP